MQKTLTYYDNQSRQIYNIINPPAKYIYFQFPIESNVITNLKVYDKSTLFHVRETEREREKETEKESTSINYPDKSETSWTKRQKKEERNKKRDTKKKRKRNNTRSNECKSAQLSRLISRPIELIAIHEEGGWNTDATIRDEEKSRYTGNERVEEKSSVARLSFFNYPR